MVLSYVQFKARTRTPPNGAILVRAVIDASSFGDLAQNLADGFSVSVSGAGLIAPETMVFVGLDCFNLDPLVKCVGTRGEVATFRKQRTPHHYAVKITALQRSFQRTLLVADATVKLSFGGRDLYGQIGGCRIFEKQLASCRR
jgi:hypothetical protein